MVNHIRRILTALTMAGLFFMAGCVNAPSLPRSLGVPPAPPSEIHPVAAESTAALDCLSASFKRANVDADKRLIALGPLVNLTYVQHAGPPPKLGKTDVPTSLKPFVRASFSRISSGFAVADEHEKIVVPVRLDGSIYFVSPFRVIDTEAEALGFGLGAKVEGFDIGIELYWSVIDPRRPYNIFEQTGTSVNLIVRVYSAEQGASAFRITSGSNGLVMANSRAIQEASPHFAIQEAVNLGVATLVRSFSERYMKVTSNCTMRSVIAGDKSPPGGEPLVDVVLSAKPNLVCARFTSRLAANQLPPEAPLMRVTELRAEGIQVAERTTQVAPLSTLIKGRTDVCLNREYFNGKTEQVRIDIIGRSGGRVLGSSTLFLQ